MMGDFVNLQISSTISQYGSEKRFDRGLTITELKGKLELITGIECSWMEIELYNQENTLIAKLDDKQMLGYYSPVDNWRLYVRQPKKEIIFLQERQGNVEELFSRVFPPILLLKVIDKNPQSQKGEFTDLSKVEKFEMPEEEYDKKQDSVRNFMKINKVGKFSEDALLQEEKKKEKEAEEEKRGRTFQIGSRCETSVPKQPKRRGIVMFVGEVEFKPGWWVGVKYDEPLGKNDGSVKGKRYFTCQQNYGGFVRPSQMEVGDFPEEDFGMELDEM